MHTDFNKYAAKGNEVLHLLADELHLTRKEALRILRAVLHTIRAHVSVEESLQIIAQLPVALKGLYVDQWKLTTNVWRTRHVHQFMEEVRQHDGVAATRDFGLEDKTEQTVIAVFSALSYYLSEGELHDMLAAFPGEIRTFIQNGLERNHIVF
ncbi:DUF2267 domain-containing protein [Paraflavitalea pollutisoli]|uniref:DUF2267 domain-containing protein n=1 Tax=Paraflavitalea pollutisoli TaxID=3034143 RepID=UPI0023EDAA09|nr:DUF2267 domain-containing protein [Paraflavitalea sp. H1-2-19X]